MCASTKVSLECGHTSLQLNHLHVKSGLFSAESSDLLLESRVLLLLMSKVALDVFLNLE